MYKFYRFAVFLSVVPGQINLLILILLKHCTAVAVVYLGICLTNVDGAFVKGCRDH